MPTLSQIFGGLTVLVMLAMAGHEIWLYKHPESQGLPVTPRRLRRRLIGALIVISMVGAFTIAGRYEGPAVTMALYTGALILFFLLLGVIIADVRDTGRQVLREQLDMSPEELEAMLQDPEVRAALEEMSEVKPASPEKSEDH